MEGLNEALLEFGVAEWARREADKEAKVANEAHHLILSKIRRCAKWTALLRVRKLKLEMLPGHVGPGVGAGLRYNLHRAESRVAPELLALESSAHADSFRLLHASVERAREEAYLATEVNVLHLMVEGQREHDRE